MSDKESSSSVSEAVRKSRGKPLEFFERPSKVSKFDASAGHGEEVEDHGELIDKNMNRSPGIQRYLIALEYIGTRFAGAQKQPNERTVVGVLEEAFQKFIGQPVSIFCSSRTDAGVHALSNVCHVDIERISKRKPGEVLPPHEPSVVNRAVNHFLQKKEGDIMVTDVRYVPIDFHARYKALERVYFYKLLSGKEPLSAFDRDRVWHVPQELNLSAMKKACDVLIGRHDFSSFRSAACQAKSPIINLDELTVTEVASSPFFPNKSETEGPDFSGFGTRKPHRCLVIMARGRSFLYHQVRLMVGVLKAVGTGDLTASDVGRILEAKNIAAASPMAPACGLYLAHVKYDLPCNE